MSTDQHLPEPSNPLGVDGAVFRCAGEDTSVSIAVRASWRLLLDAPQPSIVACNSVISDRNHGRRRKIHPLHPARVKQLPQNERVSFEKRH